MSKTVPAEALAYSVMAGWISLAALEFLHFKIGYWEKEAEEKRAQILARYGSAIGPFNVSREGKR